MRNANLRLDGEVRTVPWERSHWGRGSRGSQQEQATGWEACVRVRAGKELVTHLWWSLINSHGENLHKLLNWLPWLIYLMISRIIQATEEKWITESSIYVTFVLKFLFLYISSLFPQLSTVEVNSWHFIREGPTVLGFVSLWLCHSYRRTTPLSGRSMLN